MAVGFPKSMKSEQPECARNRHILLIKNYMKIGDKFTLRGEETEIIRIHKGGKTNKPNKQSGIMTTGYKSKPCTYEFSNGLRMKGSTILRECHQPVNKK